MHVFIYQQSFPLSSAEKRKLLRRMTTQGLDTQTYHKASLWLNQRSKANRFKYKSDSNRSDPRPIRNNIHCHFPNLAQFNTEDGSSISPETLLLTNQTKTQSTKEDCNILSPHAPISQNNLMPKRVTHHVMNCTNLYTSSLLVWRQTGHVLTTP